MNPNKMFLIAAACTLAGSLLYVVHNQLVIIHIPLLSHKQSPEPHISNDTTDHKVVKIYFNRSGSWRHEDVTVMWDKQAPANNLTHLLKQWLQTMYEEKVIHHHVSIESLAVSSMGNEAYLSFDRNLFSSEQSIASKWLIIESLFKSIRSNDITLQTITLLVHHQPMHDDHLDFSQPLPLHERFS